MLPNLRRTIPLLLIVACAHALEAAEPPSIALTKETTVSFASQPRGREFLSRRDDFLGAVSKFDLQSRLKTDKDVAVDDLVELYRENVVEWTEADAAAVAKALEFVRDRVADYRLPLPETVYLVSTTGKEESGAAYCRGPAIVLPQNQVRGSEMALRRLVAHELFHVLSSHNPELRGDLYAIIGFTLCELIALPRALAHRAITNPDAPRVDCTIELTLDDGTRVTAAPLLISSADRFDPVAGKSMFDYLQFRLLVVEKHEGAWRAVATDGEPRLIDPRKVEDFWKQIGRNTSYIIHPDEILADNFMHLVMQTEKLSTPEIVAKLRERLERQ